MGECVDGVSYSGSIGHGHHHHGMHHNGGSFNNGGILGGNSFMGTGISHHNHGGIHGGHYGGHHKGHHEIMVITAITKVDATDMIDIYFNNISERLSSHWPFQYLINTSRLEVLSHYDLSS